MTDEELTLHLAALRGDVQALDKLLSRGDDPQALDEEGLAPLHHAAIEGEMDDGGDYLGVARSLLRAGGDADVLTEDGMSALYYAVGTGNVALTELLLEHGADPRRATQEGWTPVHEAAQEADAAETLGVLLTRGADANARVQNGMTALHFAAKRGAGPQVRALLDAGADPAAATDDGFTVLHAACAGGLADVVEQLLERGIDPAQPTKEGLTPLHCAAPFVGTRDSNADVVALLLRRGVDVAAKTKDGRTPADLAINRAAFEEIAAPPGPCGAWATTLAFLAKRASRPR